MVMNSIDLHIHSTFSDGVLRPSELVVAATKLDLQGLALTDHDTVEGLDEFMETGAREKLETVAGIEISSYFGEQPVHILGYGMDWRHAALVEQVEEMQRIRDDRNRKIQNRFKGLGIRISDEDLARVSEGQIGRPHFAMVLCDKGIVTTVEQAFVRYLRKNGQAYVAKEKYAASEAIRAIRKAGGITVLAHPWCTDHSLRTIPLLLNRLQDIGLEGVEVYYPAHSAATRDALLDMARRLRLLVTGGSDFHGTGHSARLAGDGKDSFLVPAELLDDLRKRLPANQKRRVPLTAARE